MSDNSRILDGWQEESQNAHLSRRPEYGEHQTDRNSTKGEFIGENALLDICENQRDHDSAEDAILDRQYVDAVRPEPNREEETGRGQELDQGIPERNTGLA